MADRNTTFGEFFIENFAMGHLNEPERRAWWEGLDDDAKDEAVWHMLHEALPWLDEAVPDAARAGGYDFGAEERMAAQAEGGPSLT